MSLNKGFSLLEMVVTLAVMGAAAGLVYSGMDGWSVKKSYKNLFNNLRYELSNLRNQAMSRDTTTRMLLQNNSGVYTITTYASSTPTTTCSTTGTWTQISSSNLDINSAYQITGSGVGTNLCFYRDGSSSGASFVISPVESGTDYNTATIDVTIATGYLDVLDE